MQKRVCLPQWIIVAFNGLESEFNESQCIMKERSVLLGPTERFAFDGKILWRHNTSVSFSLQTLGWNSTVETHGTNFYSNTTSQSTNRIGRWMRWTDPNSPQNAFTSKVMRLYSPITVGVNYFRIPSVFLCRIQVRHILVTPVKNSV